MTDQEHLIDPPIDIDCLVANPPYVRARDLPDAYDSQIFENLSTVTGRDIPASSPLQALFLYDTQRILQPGGRAAILVPSEVLETSYGRTLKRLLLDAVDLRTLVLFDRQESVFDDAVTTSLILVFEQLSDDAQPTEPIQFIYVEDMPDRSAFLEALSANEGQPDWGTIRCIDQSSLDPDRNWTNHFKPITIQTDGLVPLAEVAEVSRGILTGDNGFFCLSKTEIETWEISSEYLAPVVRGTRTAPGYEYTQADWEAQYGNDKPVSLLYHTEGLSDHPALQPAAATLDETADTQLNTDQRSLTGVIGYLHRGLVQDGIHEDGVASNREPWFGLDRRAPPAILATYMSRGRHRFISNAADARYLTNFVGLYPEAGIGASEQDALLAYLNSSLVRLLIERRGRTHGNGLVKIEPGELSELPAIDPRRLDSATVQALAASFETLQQAGRSAEGVEAAVDNIDALLRTRLDLRWPAAGTEGA